MYAFVDSSSELVDELANALVVDTEKLALRQGDLQVAKAGNLPVVHAVVNLPLSIARGLGMLDCHWSAASTIAYSVGPFRLHDICQSIDVSNQRRC